MPAEVVRQVLTAIRSALATGAVPGAIVGVLRDGAVDIQAVGSTATDGATALSPQSLVRISSNTKPIAAALALALRDDGLLDLDDPVDRFIPELAKRRVLRRLDGSPDDTVPALSQITIADLLTMRLGFGFVFEAPCPTVDLAGDAGLGIGPPDPAVPLTPDEWIARFTELPLLEQPGSVWRYDLAYAVLGVVLNRAAAQPLDSLLRDRITRPLGMVDTDFVARPGSLPHCYSTTESGLAVFDPPDGRWTTPPSFPDARGGLVSTAADLLRFAQALFDGGQDVLSERSVTEMTTDQLTAEQRSAPSAQAFLDGAGWGHGVQVIAPDHGTGSRLARYGWGGGLGTLWYSWPDYRTAVVVLTQVLPPSAELVESSINAVEQTLLTE